MCIVWCQLFVNGSKHTTGWVTIREGRGPFYEFNNIKSGNKEGKRKN